MTKINVTSTSGDGMSPVAVSAVFIGLEAFITVVMTVWKLYLRQLGL
jgi:hypothetical protein